MKNHHNVEIEHEFDKLSQDDLAEGWIQVLPRKHKNNEMYHFIISLAELPHYLWKYLDLYLLFNENNSDDENCITITDKIYTYSIQKSEHNILIYNLYSELTCRYKNNNKLLELYNNCKKNKIHGWIMLRTKKYLDIL